MICWGVRKTSDHFLNHNLVGGIRKSDLNYLDLFSNSTLLYNSYDTKKRGRVGYLAVLFVVLVLVVIASSVILNEFKGKLKIYDKKGNVIGGEYLRGDNFIFLKTRDENFDITLKLKDIKDVETGTKIFLDRDPSENLGFETVYIPDSLKVDYIQFNFTEFKPFSLIAECSSFDLGGFRCREWKGTEIKFERKNGRVNFEVNKTGVYSGYLNFSNLTTDVLDVEIINRLGEGVNFSLVETAANTFLFDRNGSKVKLYNVDNTQFKVFIDKESVMTGKGAQTELVYFPRLKFKEAEIKLKQIGPRVNKVLKCEYFDLGEFICDKWQLTNLTFVHDGGNVIFNITEAGIYAGGFSGDVFSSNIDVRGFNYSNKKLLNKETSLKEVISNGSLVRKILVEKLYSYGAYPLVYEDNGLRDIDRFITKINRTDYNLAKFKDNYVMYFSNYTEEGILQLEFNNSYLKFMLENQSRIMPYFDLIKKRIVYPNLLNGMDLGYRLKDNGFKQEILVNGRLQDDIRFILALKNVNFVKKGLKYVFYNNITSEELFFIDYSNLDDDINFEIDNTEGLIEAKFLFKEKFFENVNYPFVIETDFVPFVSNLNMFSCVGNGNLLNCNDNDVFVLNDSQDVAVVDFNLSGFKLSDKEEITKTDFQLYCFDEFSGVIKGFKTKRSSYKLSKDVNGFYSNAKDSGLKLSDELISCKSEFVNLSFSNFNIEDLYSFSLKVSELNSGKTIFGNENSINYPLFFIKTLFENQAPTQDIPILNSTYNQNTSEENLTVYNISTSDIGGDNVENTIVWKRNNLSDTNLVVIGFETNNSVRDYSNDLTGVVGANLSFGYFGVNKSSSNSGAFYYPGGYVKNESDNIIRFSDVSLIDNLKSMSIGFWFKNSKNYTEPVSLLSHMKDNGNEGGWNFLFNNQPKDTIIFRLYSKDGSNFTLSHSFDNFNNSWSYVSAIFNNSDKRLSLFLNGVEVSNLSLGILNTGEPSGNTGKSLFIGGRLLEEGFNGIIDEVSIWNLTLSNEQINSFYNNGIFRNNRIHYSMLGKGENWSAIVIPSDLYSDGFGLESNFMFIRSEPLSLGLSIETLQDLAVVEKPVKWTKKIKLDIVNETDFVSVMLPPTSSNVTVKQVTNVNGRIVSTDLQMKEIFPGVIEASVPPPGIIQFYNNIKNILSEEESLSLGEKEIIVKNAKTKSNLSEYEIEYFTEAPDLNESNITNSRKLIVVSTDYDLNYTKVLTFSSIPEITNNKNVIKLYWYVNNTKVIYPFNVYDLDKNGLYDYIAWITPHLSNQTFEISITVLNVQSYPIVGGDWIVRFVTTGLNNLTISAVNGTTYSEYYKDDGNTINDLVPTELKCGDEVLFNKQTNYSKDNIYFVLNNNREIHFNATIGNSYSIKSLKIVNYSCDNGRRGFYTVKVLTPGKHYQRLYFGDEFADARNDAGAGCTAPTYTDGTGAACTGTGSCSGTPDGCFAHGDSESACTAAGCSWGGFGQCSGTHVACSTYADSSTCTHSCTWTGSGDTTCIDADADNTMEATDYCHINTECSGHVGASCNYYNAGSTTTGICALGGAGGNGCSSTPVSGEFGTGLTGGSAANFHTGNENVSCSDAGAIGKICSTSGGYNPSATGYCDSSSCNSVSVIALNCVDQDCATSDVSTISLSASCTGGYACDSSAASTGWAQDGMCLSSLSCQTTGYVCKTSGGMYLSNGCDNMANCVNGNQCDATLTNGNFDTTYGTCSGSNCVAAGGGGSTTGTYYEPLEGDMDSWSYIGTTNSTITNGTSYNTNQTLNFSNATYGVRAIFVGLFNQSDVDLRNLTIEVDTFRTVVNKSKGLFGVSSNHTIIVPNVTNTGVYICQNASALDDVNKSCSNIVRFTHDEAVMGTWKSGVRIEFLKNVGYIIGNLTGSGGANNRVPTQGIPILNSSLGTNTTNENLTLYNVSTNDLDNDSVQNTIVWRKNNLTNGAGSVIFDMSFENVANATDFAHGINGTAGANVSWGYVGVNKSESNRTRSGAFIFRGDQSLMNPDPSLIVNVSDVSRIDNLTTMTIELWFNNNDTLGYGSAGPLLLSHAESSSTTGGGWQLAFGNAANTLRFTLFGGMTMPGQNVSIAANTTGSTNRNWNYVAIVFNGTRMELVIYVNGVNEGNVSTVGMAAPDIKSTGIPTGTDGKALYIGGLPFMGRSIFNGSIDEVRIWNASLSQDQIQYFYKNGVFRHNSIPASLMEVGNNWTALMTGSDDVSNGRTNVSNSVEIILSSTPVPSVTQASFNPSIVYTNNTINTTTNHTHPSGSKGNVTFALFVNNIKQNESSVTNVANGQNASVVFGNNWNKTQNLTIQVNASDGTSSSTYKNSSVIVQNFIPLHSAPILNSTTGANSTTETLTVYNVSTTDADLVDNPQNTIVWRKNNNSNILGSTIFLMSFEANKTTVRDYAQGINGTVGTNVSWMRVGVNKSESNRTRSGAFIFRGDQSLSSSNPSLIVNVSDVSRIDNLTTMTIELWFNNNDTLGYSFNAGPLLLSHAESSSTTGGGWQLAFGNAANTLRFTLFGGVTVPGQNVSIAANTTGSTNNAWKYVAIVFNGTRMELVMYVNGVNEGNVSTVGMAAPDIKSTGIPTGTDGKALYIGGLPFIGSSIFNGSIDEVRIWNKSLTHNEILQIYNGSSGVYKHNILPPTLLGDGGDNWTAIMTVSDGTNDSIDRISNNVQIVSAAASVADTPPSINFTNPTPANNTQTTNTSVIINVTVNEANNISQVIFNWNGTNYTVYNNSLVLMMNFENRSAFGENATFVVDVSEYNNTGNTFGNVAANSTGGKYGSGLSFDGNDYVKITNANTNLKLNNNAATFSAWVYPRTISSTTFNMIVGNNFNVGWQFGLGYADNVILFTGGINTGDVAVSTGTLSTKAWHHVVAVWNNNTMNASFYIDGSYAGSELNSAPIGNGATTFYIGADGRDGVGYEFNGFIDEIRVWNRTLTADEVNISYKSNLQRFNATDWEFFVNMTNLSVTTYSYFVSATDNNSNYNSTETRQVVITSSANAAPAVTQASFDPFSVFTNTTTINVTANYTDADSNKGNVTFTLFVNNIKQNESSVTNVVDGQNASVVFGNNWNKTQNLTVQVNASDGSLSSSYINSSINVSNVIPRPGSPAISPPSVSNTSTNFISFSSVTDSDTNDKINVTITWFKNNIAIRNTTKTDQSNNTNVTDILAQGNYTGGDTIIVQYNVSEGGSQSHYVNSTSVTTGLGCSNINTAGVYTLDRSLNPAGGCFNIGVSNVTLNCAGYYINYSLSSAGIGINVSGSETGQILNITIRNCILIQNTTQENSQPIWFGNVFNSSIENNTINASGTVGDQGVYFWRSHSNNLSNNKISTKDDSIFFTFGSQNNTITLNNISSIEQKGISLAPSGSEDSGLNKIAHNYINASLTGIYAGSSFKNNISYNNITVFGATNDGINLQSSAKNTTISYNNITSHGADTNSLIEISSANNTIIYNVLKSALRGTTDSPDVISLGSNAAYNNISNNNISTFGQKGNAFEVTGNGASHNWIENNTIIINDTGGGNPAAAIELGGDITNNTFKKNNVTKALTSFLFISGLGGVTPENNTLINNTLYSTGSGSEIAFQFVSGTKAIHDTVFEDQPVKNYSFGASGGRVIIRKTGIAEVKFLETINGTGDSLLSFEPTQAIDPFANVTELTNDTFEVNLTDTGNTTNINLTDWVNITADGNITSSAFLDLGAVFFNITKNVGLNHSANVTLYNLASYSYTGIARENTTCTTTTNPPCYNFTAIGADNVTFNVTSFSNYRLVQTTNVNRCQSLAVSNTAYSLTKNVDLSTRNNCFTVYGPTSNITFDCQGYTINLTGGGTGIMVYGRNVTIKNCNIKGSSTTINHNGIFVFETDNVFLVNNSINLTSANLHSQYGINVRDSKNVTLSNNNMVVYGSGYATGIVATGSTNLTIQNNTISINSTSSMSYGIRLLKSNFSATSNKIMMNASEFNFGIYLKGAATFNNNNNLIVENNNITMFAYRGGSNSGIFVNFINHTRIINNTINMTLRTNTGSSSLTGVNVYSTAVNNTVSDNKIHITDRGYGINVLATQSNNNRIEGNNITTNGTNSYGINLYSDVQNSLVNNNIIETNGTNAHAIQIFASTNNTIANNTVKTLGKIAHGINLASNSFNNIIDKNTISQTGTGGHGFRISGTKPENNTISNNTLSNIGGTNMQFETAITGKHSYHIITDQNIGNYSFTSPGVSLIVNNSKFGEIVFYTPVNGSGSNFSSDIQIGNNSIYINDAVNSGFNTSANVTIRGINITQLTNPVILRNGVACNATTGVSCFNYTSLNASLVKFNVTGFSNYSIGNPPVEGGANTAPVIGNVSNVSAVTLSEKSNITVTFYFVAHDVDGVANLNDNSPNIVVNFTQVSTTYIRTNTSAVTTCGLVADINAVSANYSCEVDIWFFDPAGSWSINVSILDNSNGRGENSSGKGQGATFNVNTLTALQMAPTSLTWASITLVAKNTTSNNDPIYLNNTGNVNITNVTVTAIDLQGETTRSQYIFAENFSASNATGNSQECNIAGGAGNASKMRNNTAIDVNNTLLPVGNNTINSGASLGQVGQEELFFCLLEVPPTISSQSYSSSALGAWTITIAA